MTGIENRSAGNPAQVVDRAVGRGDLRTSLRSEDDVHELA